MKKKYLLYLLFSLISLTLVFVLIKNNKKEVKLEQTSYGSAINIIKSTESHKIQNNGIEATEVKLFKLKNSLKVVSTLKNNTESDINGFFIELELLDSSGKTVFPMSVNSDTKIPAGKTVAIENYATLDNTTNEIVDVRIKTIEKDIQSSVVEEFDKMQAQ